jgi:hypothetical protein
LAVNRLILFGSMRFDTNQVSLSIKQHFGDYYTYGVIVPI